MIKAQKGLTPEWYTPEQSGEEDQKTAFELKPLNGIIAMQVLAEGYSDKEKNYRIPGSAMEKALQHGLIGWRNVNDETGQQVKFAVENFGCLPAMVLQELATQIISISQLTADDEKN